ncbi:hypothetical protein NP233_g11010 [Leucocoprinus birnbaumii]|uniref:Tc1-like transposase DDE domain-containing protein n=1 Tax=Leucocoprinus birnbaumii TaxID=56174 RepID=A0AAD5VHU0_9AGAR|nr:hypothetical protein NP233_g11010 [Leucocoprinus birnbaumii]
MENAFFNGKEQAIYFPDDHPTHPGQFKGMEQILWEQGYIVTGNHFKKAQCGTSFKDCPADSTDCCCRWLLYNQPDFLAVESRLEKFAWEQGYKVLFLPKSHCELNFIEQCWGYAKREYRLFPPSSASDILEKNVLKVLGDIPVESMRRFATQALRFTDAYSKGLNGTQAAWAARKFCGHQVIPDLILRDLLPELSK